MRPTSLKDLEYFLLDMDGTVYLGPDPIPGSKAFIDHLNQSGRKHLFFTNNPTRDASQYSKKLAGMGIKAAPEDILTSGEATARYLASATSFRKVYAVGTPSFEEELRRAGLELSYENADAVVLAFDLTLTYEKLERACLLLREGLPFIATNPDLTCPTEYGYIPDCGATAALIEAATGRKPKYIGKPSSEMIEMGIQKLGADPERTAMVGDRLYTDMEMAFRANITSVLVLSGESQREDLKGAVRLPDYVYESVAALGKALESAG